VRLEIQSDPGEHAAGNAHVGRGDASKRVALDLLDDGGRLPQNGRAAGDAHLASAAVARIRGALDDGALDEPRDEERHGRRRHPEALGELDLALAFGAADQVTDEAKLGPAHPEEGEARLGGLPREPVDTGRRSEEEVRGAVAGGVVHCH
jgi:hypothetical protein